MLFSKHKILTFLTVCVLLLGITVGAFAIAGGKKPTSQSGGFYNPVADRMEISVENTDFVLKKASSSSERYTVSLNLSVKKTQSDFYAMLNSFTLSGLAYENIVFTALNDDTKGKTTDSLVLPVKNGEPVLLKWQVDITFSVVNKGVYKPTITLDYTSGMTPSSAQQKLTEIPLSITVN